MWKAMCQYIQSKEMEKSLIKIFTKLKHKCKEELERKSSSMRVNEQQTSPNKEKPETK